MSAYILIFVVAAVAADDVLSFSFLFVCCLFVCMLFFCFFFVFIYLLFCSSFIKLVLFRFLARFSISRTYLNLHKCNSLLYILGSTNISYIF